METAQQKYEWTTSSTKDIFEMSSYAAFVLEFIGLVLYQHIDLQALRWFGHVIYYWTARANTIMCDWHLVTLENGQAVDHYQ